MSKKEKDSTFNECICYEFHLFLKQKDPAYFKAVVVPYLQSKMEKHFMDYYLLNDKKNLLKFASLSKVDELNYMEKCCLIDALVRIDSCHEFAVSIVSRMQLEMSTSQQKSGS